MVADFGGPGDIVHPEVGYKVPLTNESDIVAQMEKILTELAHNRDRLEQLRRQGMAYVRECLTWDAKAQAVTRVLNWVVGEVRNQIFRRPRMLLSAESLACFKSSRFLMPRAWDPREFDSVIKEEYGHG